MSGGHAGDPRGGGMQYEARLESSEMWVVVSEDGSQRIPFGRGHARRVQAEVTAAALRCAE